MYWQLDSRAIGKYVPSKKLALEYRFRANCQRIAKKPSELRRAEDAQSATRDVSEAFNQHAR
jgi:histone H3/H4